MNTQGACRRNEERREEGEEEEVMERRKYNQSQLEVADTASKQGPSAIRTLQALREACAYP